MLSSKKQPSKKLKNRIQARCDQVRESWTDSERAVRRLWAKIAQRRLLSAALAREPIQ